MSRNQASPQGGSSDISGLGKDEVHKVKDEEKKKTHPAYAGEAALWHGTMGSWSRPL